MKKIIISGFLCCLALCGFAEKYSKNNQGTYIPYDLFKTVCVSKSYGEAIFNKIDKDAYTVLAVEGDQIKSNLRFHDAYVLSPEKASGFTFKNDRGAKLIIDSATQINYIRISTDTDYYAAFDQFLFENILVPFVNMDEITADDKIHILISDKEYTIVKDEWLYTENIKLLFYSREDRKYLCISEENGSGGIYETVEGDIFSRVRGKKCYEYVFSFKAKNLHLKYTNVEYE